MGNAVKPRNPWTQGRLRNVTSLAELREMFATVTSSTAGDARFSAQANLYSAERLTAIEATLVRIEQALTKDRKRGPQKLSAWQKFFAAGMKAGKTPKQVGQEWRVRGTA